MTDEHQKVTAAAVLIGNELLSGRVVDQNMHYIATSLVDEGIDLVEVRVVPDEGEKIVQAIRELKDRVDYVFTTGGIGPTHDDITAEYIAKAFSQPLIQHPETARILREYFESKGIEANEERMRMANMPEGAEPVLHDHGPVPGFRMENVFVMAGVPRVMQAMLKGAIPLLRKGQKVHSASLRCNLQEGTIAKPLGVIQQKFPQVDIGSYPLSKQFNYDVSLVVRGRDSALVLQVFEEINSLVATLGGKLIDDE